jgi:hypothetical protein
MRSFNKNILAGMSPEDAAASTFTGTMAARYGFIHVRVVKEIGSIGAATDVEVIFTR